VKLSGNFPLASAIKSPGEATVLMGKAGMTGGNISTS
jgi:hypothetical protein